MSYEKKYLPENSDIKEEWDEREDRVESEFSLIDGAITSTSRFIWTYTLSGDTRLNMNSMKFALLISIEQSNSNLATWFVQGYGLGGTRYHAGKITGGGIVMTTSLNGSSYIDITNVVAGATMHIFPIYADGRPTISNI